VSYGELLSAEIVTAALRQHGIDGVHVDARDVIITDANFGRATADLPALTIRARERLGGAATAGRVPVMQGFVGATGDRIPTTLGRGGSDYTAALVGAAIGAAEVEIWTDVDGFMTADPRVVSSARTLGEVSYDEAAELAFFGARVLHPATVLPVVNQEISVRILNSCRPASPGTTIVARRTGVTGDVRSIAFKTGVTTLTLRAPRMLGAHGFLASMFAVFERHGVAVDVVTTSEVSVSLSLDTGSPDERLLAALREMGELSVNRDRAIVCVVGEGLRDTPGVPGRVFQALQSFNVEMISLGASKINLTFILDQKYAADAVRRLHTEFFGTA
jgi:aspartate kinase